LLIGPASTASVSAATDAARPLGVPVMLDAPADRLSHAWVTEMERAGVDGFTLTTIIDVGTGSRGPLLRARELRSWTRLPVAVSGGFSPTDDVFAHGRDDWDILIVGRAVTDAVDPAAAALRIAELVHANSEGAS
jgi:3-keto-L-gulonate-6-phosphate decarboxylase